MRPQIRGLPAAQIKKDIIKEEAFKLDPKRWVDF